MRVQTGDRLGAHLDELREVDQRQLAYDAFAEIVNASLGGEVMVDSPSSGGELPLPDQKDEFGLLDSDELPGFSSK